MAQDRGCLMTELFEAGDEDRNACLKLREPVRGRGKAFWWGENGVCVLIVA
jgi:hypothetical protein